MAPNSGAQLTFSTLFLISHLQAHHFLTSDLQKELNKYLCNESYVVAQDSKRCSSHELPLPRDSPPVLTETLV